MTTSRPSFYVGDIVRDEEGNLCKVIHCGLTLCKVTYVWQGIAQVQYLNGKLRCVKTSLLTPWKGETNA